MAHRCEANACEWDGDALVLDSGDRIRSGFVQNYSSSKERLDAPDQQFVCWYAFACKFPNCEIFASPG
jgi:hypothetical protein